VKATEVTAGLAESNACQVYGVIHFTLPAGWLPVHRDQLRAQRSVTSMGKLYHFYHWLHGESHPVLLRRFFASLAPLYKTLELLTYLPNE